MHHVFDAGRLLMIVVLILLSLPFSVLWIVTIIDCVRNEPDPVQRHRWLLIILFFSVLGALAYWFLRRPGRSRQLPEHSAQEETEQRSIFVRRPR